MALTMDMVNKATRRAVAASPFRSVLVIDGRAYIGTRSSSTDARRYRPEGFSPDYRLTWLGVRADFVKLPHTGQPVFCDNEPLRVTATQEDAQGGMLRVDLSAREIAP